MGLTGSQVNTPKGEMSLTGTKVNTPKGELSLIGTEVNTPKAEMSLTGKEVNTPKGEMSLIGTEVNTPKGEMSLTGTDGAIEQLTPKLMRMIIRASNCIDVCFVSERLYDKFKRTGSVHDDKKAMAMATASVATDETKERVDDFFAANHLLMHLNSPLANETHTYTIAHSNDHAHQVWSQLLAASAIY
ncbi:hypothetical protein AVEN_128514-1 [Araneus ventricosus]|uniref:Uncharacterized protein n=1 Tax=Araneus ventricosus TaxID=182803 RepID=A0A4Y2HNN6_ARAVE|nr:hypothetical protein AVEN_128514-1 [Araneus ventricosus]